MWAFFSFRFDYIADLQRRRSFRDQATCRQAGNLPRWTAMFIITTTILPTTLFVSILGFAFLIVPFAKLPLRWIS